jgi:hypothetical protein
VDKKLAEETVKVVKEKAEEAAVNKKRAKIEQKVAAGKNHGKRVPKSRNSVRRLEEMRMAGRSRPRCRAKEPRCSCDQSSISSTNLPVSRRGALHGSWNANNFWL